MRCDHRQAKAPSGTDGWDGVEYRRVRMQHVRFDTPRHLQQARLQPTHQHQLTENRFIGTQPGAGIGTIEMPTIDLLLRLRTTSLLGRSQVISLPTQFALFSQDRQWKV